MFLTKFTPETAAALDYTYSKHILTSLVLFHTNHIIQLQLQDKILIWYFYTTYLKYPLTNLVYLSSKLATG
jgi:hypothetical protein